MNILGRISRLAAAIVGAGALLGALAEPSIVPAAAQTAEPALEVLGGGFVFNYRVARAYYGVLVRPARPLPDGATIEAEFENPAGGEPFVVRMPHPGGARRISLRSPDVTGVVAGRDYLVRLRVRDGTSDRIIAEQTKTLRSDLDQSVLPDKPPIVGPGFERNPDDDLDKKAPAAR